VSKPRPPEPPLNLHCTPRPGPSISPEKDADKKEAQPTPSGPSAGLAERGAATFYSPSSSTSAAKEQATSAAPPPPSATPAVDVLNVGGQQAMDYRSDDSEKLMAAKINAVAGKINAARELARRLAEERNAAAKPEV